MNRRRNNALKNPPHTLWLMHNLEGHVFWWWLSAGFGEQQKGPTLTQGLADLILTHATEIENTKMWKYEKDKSQTFLARIQWPFSHGFKKNPKKKKNYENVKAEKYYLWHRDSLSSSICRADLIHMHATKMFQSLICFQLEHKFAFIFQREKIITWIELSWRLI